MTKNQKKIKAGTVLKGRGKRVRTGVFPGRGKGRTTRSKR